MPLITWVLLLSLLRMRTSERCCAISNYWREMLTPKCKQPRQGVINKLS